MDAAVDSSLRKSTFRSYKITGQSVIQDSDSATASDEFLMIMYRVFYIKILLCILANICQYKLSYYIRNIKIQQIINYLAVIINYIIYTSRLEMTQKIANPQTEISTDKAPRRQLYIFIGSTISCVITMTVCNPLEVAKLKYQYSPIACPQYPHPSFKQLNNCECTKFSFADSFKGLSISLFHGLISNTLYMQFYEYQRQIFIKHLPSSLATLSAAMFSRLMVTTIMIPIQAFRVRFTNSTKQAKIKTTKTGLQATLARDMIYSCMYWFTIEQVRSLLLGAEYRDQKQKHSNFRANVIPAMVGGSLISFITTPLDTIKTRLQSGVQMQGSLWSQLKTIYGKQGYPGLFAGVQHRVTRNTISSVLYLSIFQSIIGFLQNGKYFMKDSKAF